MAGPGAVLLAYSEAGVKVWGCRSGALRAWQGPWRL